MALSDAEILALRLFVNQGHNDVVWAQKNNAQSVNRSDDEWAIFNPLGVAEDQKTLEEIDKEFGDNLLWLSEGRKPWVT